MALGGACQNRLPHELSPRPPRRPSLLRQRNRARLPKNLMQRRSYEATLSVLCLFSAVAIGQELGLKSGFVPDATTATKIAEAVLVPLNGQKKIVSELLFRGIERQCPDRTLAGSPKTTGE